MALVARGDDCTIVGGRDAGMEGSRAALAGIGVKIPSGRSRLRVTLAEDGRWWVHGTMFKRVTLGRSAVPIVDGVNFCWLPGEFRGRRVTIAVERRASANGRGGAKSPKRQRSKS